MRERALFTAMRRVAYVALCVGLAARSVAAELSDDAFDWYDARELQFEGQAKWEATAKPYDRLPSDAEGKVSNAIWNMGHHSTGYNVRFVPHSDIVRIKWQANDVNWFDPQMTMCSMSGIDVYEWRGEGKGTGGWYFRRLGKAVDKGKARPQKCNAKLDVVWTSGTPCLVNFPLRATIGEFKIGVKKGSKIEKTFAHKTPRKPVVIYGTSIVHGCNATRPGMAFVNIAGRIADVEMIDLGFSGSARMEPELCDIVSRIDASLYIIDPLWNMDLNMMAERYEPFIRKLKEARPATPILLCEDCSIDEWPTPKGKFVDELYAKLKAEDAAKWANLFIIHSEEMYPDDGEATIDHCHPNDWGMMHMGRAYAAKIKEILAK